MIASMTGFGRGTSQAGSLTATVEMRSVNNRYIDVSVRLPQNLADREGDVQARVKDAFERGRITVSVQVEKEAGVDLPVRVNLDAARAYGRLLNDLRRAAGLDEPVRLEDLLRYYADDVFAAAEEDPAALEQTWKAVVAALDDAIAQMHAMRQQEGEALRADLATRLDALEERLGDVEARAPLRVEEARIRLQERLDALLADQRFDPERLEQEIALLADKLDVTEECVRLHSHLNLFREALDADEAVGRKLNFIVQEIHREVNTIGSKANDAEVARLAVAMKEDVEKMREQIQNVE